MVGFKCLFYTDASDKHCAGNSSSLAEGLALDLKQINLDVGFLIQVKDLTQTNCFFAPVR